MEEELERLISIIQSPASRTLDLSNLMAYEQLGESELDTVMNALSNSSKVFDVVVASEFDISLLSEEQFIKFYLILSLCQPASLYLKNINLADLSYGNTFVLIDMISRIGVKVLDISGNELNRCDFDSFSEICKLLASAEGLSSVYITGTRVMCLPREYQELIWKSIFSNRFIDEVYIWQNSDEVVLPSSRELILEKLGSNYSIKFIGVYTVEHAPDFIESINGIVGRNSFLQTWVLNKLKSGDYKAICHLEPRLSRHNYTIIDWAVEIGVDSKNIYDWHNSLYRMLVKVARLMYSKYRSDAAFSHALEYAVNNWAMTSKGKNGIVRSFEMNRESIKKKVLKSPLEPIELYSYDRTRSFAGRARLMPSTLAQRRFALRR